MLIFAGTGSAKPNDAATHSSVKAGGTVSMALPPSTVVNYIFPFMGLQFFSVYNISYMQQTHVPAALLVRQGQPARR